MAVRISALRRGREGDTERRVLSKRVRLFCKALPRPPPKLQRDESSIGTCQSNDLCWQESKKDKSL